MSATITSDIFGQTEDGINVTRYTLTNSSGTTVKIIDYGATITEVCVADRDGNMADVNLSFDSVRGYESSSHLFPMLGAVCGRVANVVAGGKFELDGKTYSLVVNRGRNALHGGVKGFDKRVWTGKVKDNSLVLTYISEDGEEGYPGQVTTHLTYSLSETGDLTLDYTATSTQATPFNLTNHAYFNLGGHGSGHIKDHVITLHADHYTPIDEHDVPTGEIRPVTDSPFDLRSPVKFGDRLCEVGGGRGFVHNFCVGKSGDMKLVARVSHPPSGRVLSVQTTCPGLQLYTAFYLEDMADSKAGAVYGRHGAFCLEAQHYPDSVNQPNFPSTILRPGETYTQKTIYTFGVM